MKRIPHFNSESVYDVIRAIEYILWFLLMLGCHKCRLTVLYMCMLMKKSIYLESMKVASAITEPCNIMAFSSPRCFPSLKSIMQQV